jgi:hypothetical protein
MYNFQGRVGPYLAKKNTSLKYKKLLRPMLPWQCCCGTESITLSTGGADSMMLSARIESIILSAPSAESMMLSARTESIILSALPADSMMLSAWHACALTLRAR